MFCHKPTLQKSWNTAWNIKQWDHFHDVSHNVPTLLKSSHRGYSQTDTTQPDTVCSVSLEAEQLVQTFKPAGTVALSHSIWLTAGQDESSWAWTSFVKNIQQKGKGEQKVSSKIKAIRCTQDWKKNFVYILKKATCKSAKNNTASPGSPQTHRCVETDSGCSVWHHTGVFGLISRWVSTGSLHPTLLWCRTTHKSK